MSFDLENAQVGDMLVCISNRAIKPDHGEVIGKYLVLAKEPSEANNEYINDYTGLTLHIIYRNFADDNDVNKVGRNITIPLEYLSHEDYRWNLAYRPGGKEVVQSGLSWDDHEPNENVGINTIMEDSL
jgi:hypothetical protein